MKVIDLLNKIANGEINEDTLIEFDNGYKDYCSVRIFFDRYIVDRENLNCEVEIVEEDKKIEKLEYVYDKDVIIIIDEFDDEREQKIQIEKKINEIIDYINKEK